MKKIYKLDLGYLVGIKKKILYDNVIKRYIRLKNKQLLYFKKNFRYISKVLVRNSKFRFVRKLEFNNVVGQLILKKRNVILKKIRINKSINGKIKMIVFIRDSIKKYIRKKRIIYLRAFLRMERYFRRKFRRLEFKIKMTKKKKNKKQKKFQRYNNLCYILMTTELRYFKKKRMLKKINSKLKKHIFYFKKIKLRRKILKKILSLKIIKFVMKNIDVENISKMTRFVPHFVKRLNIIRRMQKKKIKKNKFTKKHFITKFILYLRKIKIKNYILKNNIVISKYIKNLVIKSNAKIINNLNIIKDSNIYKFNNIKSISLVLKFFTNFLFYYLIRFSKIKYLKYKSLNKNKFKSKINFFSLDRYSKKPMENIFETTNSFFFFRFIKMSRKFLNLFIPLKFNLYNKLNINNIIVKEKNISYFFYKFNINKILKLDNIVFINLYQINLAYILQISFLILIGFINILKIYNIIKNV